MVNCGCKLCTVRMYLWDGNCKLWDREQYIYCVVGGPVLSDWKLTVRLGKTVRYRILA